MSGEASQKGGRQKASEVAAAAAVRVPGRSVPEWMALQALCGPEDMARISSGEYVPTRRTPGEWFRLAEVCSNQQWRAIMRGKATPAEVGSPLLASSRLPEKGRELVESVIRSAEIMGRKAGSAAERGAAVELAHGMKQWLRLRLRACPLQEPEAEGKVNDTPAAAGAAVHPGADEGEAPRLSEAEAATVDRYIALRREAATAAAVAEALEAELLPLVTRLQAVERDGARVCLDMDYTYGDTPPAAALGKALGELREQDRKSGQAVATVTPRVAFLERAGGEAAVKPQLEGRRHV